MSIYLDNSMTTKPSTLSVSKMLQFYSDRWGSPMAPHLKGQELFPDIEESYRSIYRLLGAKDDDNFVFTSSGAEAVNQVILSGYLDITKQTGRNQFVTSTIDEAPAIMSIGRLEKFDCVGRMVDADKKGHVTAQAIIESITPRTAMISLSWANGLTGVINPIAEISDICKERGIRLHLDASHVLGKLYYEIDDVGADFISFNGDNLHAPKGTGGLYIRSGVACSPLIVGGMEQGGYRAGTVNVPAFVALGQAAKEVLDARDLMCTEVARLRDKLEKGIVEHYPEALIFFGDQERVPNISAIAFPGIPNELMLYALNKKNVYASIGGGSFQQIGLVLMASGVPELTAHSAISFSLSRETHEDDIDKAIEIVVDTAKRLRRVSQKVYN
jgi:cysteine desulfurase